VRNFWQRVSEGRQIEDLWTQFAAACARQLRLLMAAMSIGEEIKSCRAGTSPLHVAKEFSGR